MRCRYPRKGKHMTDREMLEFAAKAAGYKYLWNIDSLLIKGSSGRWNPLTDDGDALRLAVKLGIRVCPVTADGRNAYAAHDRLAGGVGEPHNGDPYAATRRAIVLAAAEIGRQMP